MIPITAMVMLYMYFLLVSTIGSTNGVHSDPSSHLYRDDSEAGMLQSAEMCAVSGTMEVCQSAQRVKSSMETLYVHVCQSDDIGNSCIPELCYISTVPICFIPQILDSSTKCKSTFNLLVAGQTIRVTFYEMDIGSPELQDCVVFFDSDGGPIRNMKACDGECDLSPNIREVITPPPTTSPPRPEPVFCRDNCRRFRPRHIGGCFTCQRGFTNPPRCCDPSTSIADAADERQLSDNADQSNLKEELLTAVENVLAKFQT